MRSPLSLFLISLIFVLAPVASAQTSVVRPPKVAVLDLSNTEAGHRVADHLSKALASDRKLTLIDRDESRAAAHGVSYAGSLNMTLAEARNLGAAIDCDFFITGDARTVRRVPFVGQVFFESYAALFIVSARTGRLVMWDHLSFEAPASTDAEKLLLAELNLRASKYVTMMRRAEEDERIERLHAVQEEITIEEAPDEEMAEAQGLRLPHPYRRLRPNYTEAAERAGVEAVVDVQVDLDTEGEVTRARVVRWAGFGLDEAALNTVRQLHFRPAMRNSRPIPLRILLRYNFRRPQR